MTTDSTKPYGSELLVAVFANFRKKAFTVSEPSEIVEAFYRAKRNPRFRSFFTNYPFDEDGLDPKCEALSRGLRTLQGTMLLGRMNPYLIKYSISPEIKKDYAASVKSKIANLGRLREMANAIQRHLSAPKDSNGRTAALHA